MPSRTKMKNAAIAARNAALPKIPDELIDQFVTGEHDTHKRREFRVVRTQGGPDLSSHCCETDCQVLQPEKTSFVDGLRQFDRL
jgi:hypothetical protein